MSDNAADHANHSAVSPQCPHMNVVWRFHDLERTDESTYTLIGWCLGCSEPIMGVFERQDAKTLTEMASPETGDA